MDFPKWKHHAEHGGKLVKSKEDFEALGEGWGDDSSVWRPHLLPKGSVEELPVEKPKGKPGRKPGHASEKLGE